MDIHSARTHVQKSNEFLDTLLNSESKMYNKTRSNLQTLYSEYFRGIQVIADILELEKLNDEVEFGNTANRELLQDINNINIQAQQVANRTTRLDSFAHNSTDSLSGAEKRFMISNIGKVLESVANADIPYLLVRDCAVLLWKWYEMRFFKCTGKQTSFHYSVFSIPIWIQNIVIAYGQHLLDRTEDEFIKEFDDWCDSLLARHTNSKYGVPYSVYSISFKQPIEYATVQALGLWDILYDYGLNKLVGLHTQIDINKFALIDRFSEVPGLVDNYTYCNDNYKLLEQYGLVRR